MINSLSDVVNYCTLHAAIVFICGTVGFGPFGPSYSFVPLPIPDHTPTLNLTENSEHCIFYSRRVTRNLVKLFVANWVRLLNLTCCVFALILLNDNSGMVFIK